MLSMATRLFAVAATLAFAAGSAQAAASLQMYLSDGTDSASGITSAPAIVGSSVTVDIFLTVGPEGVSNVGYDLVTSISTALAASQKLIFVPFDGDVCNPPGSSDCILAPLSSIRLAGNRIERFNLATTLFGPVSGTYRIGRATFQINGLDEVAFENVVIFDNSLPGRRVSVTTNTFSIVPEPGTALLLGLGLVALCATRRRRE